MGHFGSVKTKVEVLEQTRGDRVYLTAVRGKPTTVYISSLNAEDPAQLNWSDAVVVYLGADGAKMSASSSLAVDDEWARPLRIEFASDRISALRRESPDDGTREKEGSQPKDEELTRLSETMAIGMTREEANRQLRAFKTRYRIRITASARLYDGSHLDGDAFGEREVELLNSDEWEFSGLRQLTHFNPPYSRVTLFFEGDKLRRIEHWTFPIELP
jgi:hypothetical protein